MSDTPMFTRGQMFYRLLMQLYPAKFRCAYGQEMMQVFRDCYRDILEPGEGVLVGDIAGEHHNSTLHRRSTVLAQFWGLILLDVAKTASNEHLMSLMRFFKRIAGIEREFAMASTFNLDVAARTDIGRVRSINEDTMVSIVPQDAQTMKDRGALFVVADGMGGHAKGEVASALAVATVRDTYYHDANPDIASSLQNALKQANLLICQQNQNKADVTSMMGTTCVAAVLKGDTVYVSNAGDSLAYLVRGEQVMQIAENHSWAAEQVRRGAMSEAEARAAGKNNVIVRCLGETPDTEIFVTSALVQDRDILVLCTDGLHTLIAEDEIRDIVTRYGADEAAQRLIAHANEYGGPDNITALVVKVTM